MFKRERAERGPMAVGEGVLQAAGARRTTEKLLIVVGIVAGAVLLVVGVFQNCVGSTICTPSLTLPLVVSGTVIIVLSVGGLLWSALGRK